MTKRITKKINSRNTETDSDKLMRLKQTILESVQEAAEIIKNYPEEYDQARSYWIAHILMALSDDHDYLGGSMRNMENSIEAIEEIEEQGDWQ